METDNDNLAENANDEDCEQAFEFWSDEGARHFNEALNEGSAYLEAYPHSIANYKEDFDGDECEYFHPDLYDPDEEDLSRDEMKVILENSRMF